MNRYKIYPASVSGGRPIIEIFEDKNGDWCHYSDVGALEAQLQQAQERISEFEAGEVLYRSRIENLESYQRDDRNLLRRAANLAGENMNLKGDIQQLQAENAALREENRLLCVAASRAMEHAKDPKVISMEDTQEYVDLLKELEALRKVYDAAEEVNKETSWDDYGNLVANNGR